MTTLKMFSKMFALTALLQLVPWAYSAEQQHVLKDRPTGPFDAKFAELVKDTLELWHVPGVSIAVVDGNDTWAEGYGISVFPSTPVTPETLFFGASTTKAFTAAAMSLLISSSNHSGLSWDTPISSLIRDDFVLPDLYSTAHVTIEDALSHRTGMPAHDGSYGGTDEKGEKRGVRDLVRSLRHLPLTAPLRTKFQYCNMMFVAVSYVVETLTGVWLGDFLRENIWEPLGMKSTYFDTKTAQAAPEPLAQGYVYYEEKYKPVPYMDLHIVSGAGAVISNVLDYSKWIRAFLTTSGPLSKADYAALKTPRMLLPTSEELSLLTKPFTGPNSYSLGWFNGVYQGYEYFGHSGGMEAFGAEVVIFPDLNYGLVSFGNTGKTSNFAILKLLYHLIDEKLAIPPEKRYDWNKQNQAYLSHQTHLYLSAPKHLYPHLPTPPLPLTLPLQNYTGTYTHPSYHTLNLVLENGTLAAYRDNASWATAFVLEHVSGEFFLAYRDSRTAPGGVYRAVGKAEFVLGSEGVPGKLGVALEGEMGVEGRIWFERV